MSPLRKTRITPEQYLEWERAASYKSEYVNGDILMMAGASERHNLISMNVGGELRQQLKGRPCKTYSSDMRVKVERTGLQAYPAVVVVCGEPRWDDRQRDTLLNPTVLIEVLSSSTEGYDRGEKFAHYRRLDSLTDYVLIAQDRVRVEHFVRQPDGQWLMAEADQLQATLHLASIDCTLSLAEVYDKVDVEGDEQGR